MTDQTSSQAISHSVYACIFTLTAVALFAFTTVGCDSGEESPTAEVPDKSVTTGAPDEQTNDDKPKDKKTDDKKTDESKQAEGEPGAKTVDESDLPDDMKKGTTKTFGGSLSVEGDPINLSKALEKGPGSKEKPVKVAAKITKVCQKKGCWFKLTDDSVERSIRVRMQGYDFFIPRNTAGGDAIVQGYLKSRTMSAKEAEHYASDQGKDIDVEESKKVVEFMASAVQISL